MIEKTVQCPKCSKIITCYGNPGETIKVTCPQCGNEGKVIFKKSITADGMAIEVSNLKGLRRSCRRR